MGSVVRDPEVGEGSSIQDKRKEIVEDSSTESDDKDDDDKDEDDSDSDDDDNPDYSEVNKKFERVESQLVLKGFSSKKRSRGEDIEFLPEEEESDDDQLQHRTKRRHDHPAQTTQSPPSPPQQDIQQPPSPPAQQAIPQPPIPPTSASDSSRIAMLEAEVASLKTRLQDHTLLLQQMAQCNDL